MFLTKILVATIRCDYFLENNTCVINVSAVYSYMISIDSGYNYKSDLREEQTSLVPISYSSWRHI